MKSYIGAIDQGTTSTRFMVFDKEARVVTMAQKEHEQIFPAPGWVEHNAEEILRCTHEVIGAALQQRGSGSSYRRTEGGIETRSSRASYGPRLMRSTCTIRVRRPPSTR